MTLQRHCVIELDSDGNTIRTVRFKKSKSPWTLDWSRARKKAGHLTAKGGNFEVVSEDFKPIEVSLDLPEKYRTWIITNVLDTADGLCLEWAGLMSQAFPELTLIKGVFETSDRSHRYGHFWCETNDGLIVDPTVQQFQDPGGQHIYAQEAEVDGTCVICGGPTYMGWEACCVYCWCEKDPPYKHKLTAWEV